MTSFSLHMHSSDVWGLLCFLFIFDQALQNTLSEFFFLRYSWPFQITKNYCLLKGFRCKGIQSWIQYFKSGLWPKQLEKCYNVLTLLLVPLCNKWKFLGLFFAAVSLFLHYSFLASLLLIIFVSDYLSQVLALAFSKPTLILFAAQTSTFVSSFPIS